MRKLIATVLMSLFLLSSPSFAELINGVNRHPSSSLRRTGAAATTCDEFPRVCRAVGSPGRDCCRKQCVDVATDDLNCGECGRRCRYGEKCCGGSCVNVMYDRRNCGGCRSRCGAGDFCRYGLCSYA